MINLLVFPISGKFSPFQLLFSMKMQDNFDDVSMHYNVKMPTIRLHKNKKWNLEHLSHNRHLSIDDMIWINENCPFAIGEINVDVVKSHILYDDLKKYPGLGYNRGNLHGTFLYAGVPFLENIKWVEENCDILDGVWDWKYISGYVTIDDVLNNPQYPWSREGLSGNPGLKVTDILKIDKYCKNATGQWDIEKISMSIDLPTFAENVNLSLSLPHASINNTLTIDAYNKINDSDIAMIGDWDWNLISEYIDYSEVLKHPDLEWSRKGLSWNESADHFDLYDLVLPNAYGEFEEKHDPFLEYSDENVNSRIPKTVLYKFDAKKDMVIQFKNS